MFYQLRITVISIFLHFFFSNIVLGSNNLSPLVNAFNKQVKDSTKISGVSVSPSKINFFLKVGETNNREITITNYTSSPQKFKISLRDFGINHNGSNNILAEGITSKYSLKQWINVSPNFVTIGPNEERKIKVRLNIPNADENNHAAWSMVLIEQVKEREEFNPNIQKGEKMGFGVVPTYAFGIWLYQNPPYLDKTNVNILSFAKSTLKGDLILKSKLENISENIAFCKTYVEITSLETGKTTKIADKKFTLLPTHKREIYFPLPETLKKGKYSSVIVVDFGNENEISIGEMEFEL